MFYQKNAILIAPNFATYCGVRGAEGPGGEFKNFLKCAIDVDADCLSKKPQDKPCPAPACGYTVFHFQSFFIWDFPSSPSLINFFID